MTNLQYFPNLQTLVEQWMQEEMQGIQFPVDFDVAWKIAGYSTKQKAKNKLKYLTEGEDFLTNRAKTSTGGRPSQLIQLTCDALKHFCLLAETEQGRQIRQYFIEAEKKWKLVEQHRPEVAAEIEILKLQAEITKNQAITAKAEENRLSLCNTVATLHGPELLMGILGKADQIVHVKEKTTEVLNLETGNTQEFLSAAQLKEAVKKRTGQNLKSMKSFVDQLKRKGRDDLIVAVNRAVTSEYVAPDAVKEAIDLVYGTAESRQMLIGE